MKQPLKSSLLICIALTTSHSLVSCSQRPNNANKPLKSPTTLINKVDQSAITFKAKYGVDYEVQGNAIAKYPHFNLTLFSLETLPKSTDTIHIYELSSKNNLNRTHISCESANPTKRHFSLEGLHFYYHSNSKGAINIYMPPQLLAYR